MDVQLLPDSAPKTVANFLAYVNAGAYNNSIIHRSVPGFIWQGGGYQLIDDGLAAIPANAPVDNEFNVSNTYGTLAMALEGSDINSATTQWFFNETDNSTNLDSHSFTVFGRIISTDTASMTVLNNIATVPVFSTTPLGSVFDQIPLLNYNGGPVQDANYVLVMSLEQLQPPFGYIDTPINNAAGVAGAVGVTGWALSSIGVQTVAVWREPVPSENPNNLVFIGNADIVSGSRPDVAKAYPGYPNNNNGWGLQVLTNLLPNSSGQPGNGNGTYNLHVLVTDTANQVSDIGTRTITVNNANSVLPFGTIDTPAQGGTESGTFVNFGWAVTPQPNIIPIDGSTIWVYIDSLPIGHPVYNNFRLDIATLFPDLQNSQGAVGYYYVDTTRLTNGLHTISWVAKDSAGNAQGLGSRYFNVQN
jgi:cyclophilin family peptidyl-prolyl cis-trans isomerase